MLAEILLRVDSRTLLVSCSRVCKFWYRTISDSHLWIYHCSLYGITLPPNPLRNVGFDYRLLCFKNPYGRNLIRNASGEGTPGAAYLYGEAQWPCGGTTACISEGRKHWVFVDEGGDGFSVERPPVGADGALVPVCFATSYGLCTKRQVVDLYKEGIQPFVLDELKPIIRVSESHAARSDCGSEYTIFVQLASENLKVNGREFRERTSTDQWVGGQWSTVCHEFSDYPEGIRYVIFQSQGRDRQFWKGFYGAKMCDATLTVSFE